MSKFSFLNSTKKPSHSQVAEEYTKIINLGSDTPNSNIPINKNQIQDYVIPSFYIKKNSKNKIIMDVLIQKKINQFKKKIITDEDIQIIQNKLYHYQNYQLSQIQFSSICSQIGEEKKLIFQNSILKRFETRTGGFDLRSYIEFLRYYSKTQYSLLHFLSIDETFNNIITKKQLKNFIKLCSRQITSLKDLPEDFIDNYTIISIQILHFIRNKV